MAPAAMVMDAAVTLLPRAAPIAYVPAPYVALLHVPMCETATVPPVENVSAELFVFALDAAPFQEHACRAYEPLLAFSLAPVVDGDAVCSDTSGMTFVD